MYFFCIILGVARQRLTQLRGSLLSKREILSTLASTVRTSVFIKETTKIYFRDVMDHVVLMIQRLDVNIYFILKIIEINLIILILDGK